MTRKRRYLISAAVLAACLAIAIGVLAILPPQLGVTKANFDRIEEGMTFDEVDALLGPEENFKRIRKHLDSGNFKLNWESNGRNATVWFEDGKFKTEKTWFVREETLGAKLRRWLHLPN